MKQIRNHQYRQKTVSSILSVQQLKVYSDNNALQDEDRDKSFVVGFETDIINEKECFCLTWSTPKLLALQHASRWIQVDTTYKLTWHGFPVLVTFNFVKVWGLYYLGMWLFWRKWSLLRHVLGCCFWWNNMELCSVLQSNLYCWLHSGFGYGGRW